MDYRFEMDGIVLKDVMVQARCKVDDGSKYKLICGQQEITAVVEGGYRNNATQNRFDMETFKLNILYDAKIKYDKHKGCYEATIYGLSQPISVQENMKTHPSWGIASLSNVGSGRDKLFGAIAYHGNHYCLTLKQAEIVTMPVMENKEYMNRSGKLIASVNFTREQLMNLLLGMNSGQGETPCTIEYAEGKYIKYEREDYNSLERQLDKVKKRWMEDNGIIKTISARLAELEKEKVTKETRAEIAELTNKLNSFINGTMVYEIEQLGETIEKLTQERQINLDSKTVNKADIELIKRLRNATSCSLKQAYETLQQTKWDYDAAHRAIVEKGVTPIES